MESGRRHAVMAKQIFYLPEAFHGTNSCGSDAEKDGRYRPPTDGGLRSRLHYVVARSAADGQTSGGITCTDGSTGFIFCCCYIIVLFHIYIPQYRNEKKEIHTVQAANTNVLYCTYNRGYLLETDFLERSNSCVLEFAAG